MENDALAETKVSRRKALATAGVALFGATGIATGSGGSKTEIVTERAGEEALVTKTVPQAWVEHKNEVERMKKQLAGNLLQHSGVQKIAITANQNKSYGGKVGMKPIIYIYGNKESPAIPNSINGISPEVRGAEKSTLTCSTNEVDDGDCLVNEEDGKDYIQGGVRLDTYGGSGTSTCIVYDPVAGEQRILTAAHLFFNMCSGTIVGDAAEYNGTVIGEVTRFDREADFAVIDADEGNFDISIPHNVDIEQKVNNAPLAECEQMVGHVSKNGVADALTSGRTMYKMGTVSAITTGEVIEYHESYDWGDIECNTHEGHGVKTTADNTHGDSGAPVFTITDTGNGLSMIDLHAQGRTPHPWGGSGCNGRDWYENQAGTAAYYLNNCYGLEFA